VLFKTDPPGFFERSYPRLLEMNTWQSINQEILCVYVCDGVISCLLVVVLAYHDIFVCSMSWQNLYTTSFWKDNLRVSFCGGTRIRMSHGRNLHLQYM